MKPLNNNYECFGEPCAVKVARIVHDVLGKLASEGKVKRYNHGIHWIRTDVEVVEERT